MAQQTVTIINPYSGATVDHDITDLTEDRLTALAEYMDEESREATHEAMAPCTPAGSFITRYFFSAAGLVSIAEIVCASFFKSPK